jgi:hypothetical protein
MNELGDVTPPYAEADCGEIGVKAIGWGSKVRCLSWPSVTHGPVANELGSALVELLLAEDEVIDNLSIDRDWTDNFILDEGDRFQIGVQGS